MTHTIVLHRVRAAALIFVLAVPLVPWPVQGAQVHGVDEQRIDLPSLIRELETANPEIKAARQRIRPMAMAGLANILGLIPVMWATGTGADVMKRLAAPMVGGVFSAMILTLFVVPSVYVMWRWWKEQRQNHGRAGAKAAS